MTNYESNDSYESELHLHVSYELMNLVSLSPMRRKGERERERERVRKREREGERERRVMDSDMLLFILMYFGRAFGFRTQL